MGSLRLRLDRPSAGLARERRRGSRPPVLALLLAAVLAVLSIGGCNGQYEGEGPGPAARLAPPEGDAARIEWSHDGGHLLAQLTEEGGEPTVLLVDLETGASRFARGYLLASVEPSAPLAWVVPITAEELASRGESLPLAPGFGPYDWPQDRLEVWSFEDEEAPTDRAEARWRPIPGAGDWIAYYEVDPLRGAYPGKLLFNNKASRGEGHKAQLPEGFGTFRPLGWSPTGRYVAVEELVHPFSDTIATPDGRRVLILNAEDGSVALDVQGPFVGDVAGAWLPSKDALVLSRQTEGVRIHAEDSELQVLHIPFFDSASQGSTSTEVGALAPAVLGQTGEGVAVEGSSDASVTVWTITGDDFSPTYAMVEGTGAAVARDGRVALWAPLADGTGLGLWVYEDPAAEPRLIWPAGAQAGAE